MDKEYKDIKPKPELFERGWVRWTLFGLIPALVFVLVSAGIRVSQYGIDHTVLVYGDDVLVSGRPAAIRVSLMADDGRFFLPEALEGFLVRGKERHLLFGGPVSDRGQALGRDFKVPAIESGKYELELDIRFDKRRRKVHAPVTVVAAPPKEALNVPADTQLETPIASVKKGEIEVQALPEDRGAPTGLTSVMFLRTLDAAGKPVSIPLEMGLFDGEDTIQEPTNRLGVLGIPVKPRELAMPIRVTGSRAADAPAALAVTDGGLSSQEVADGGRTEPEDAVMYPNVVYSGISASVDTPLAIRGEPISVTVEQIAKGGPLYVDLFYEGRLVKAASGWLSGQKAAIDVKPELPGIYRLQLSTTPFSADKGVAVRHFYVLDEGETRIHGLRAILETLGHSERDGAWAEAVLAMPLEQKSGYTPELAAAFALSRLYKGHRSPPNLVSSRREDDRELNAFKAEFQRMVMLAIIAIGLGVSLLITFFAYTAYRRQQQLSQMIISGLDDEETAETPHGRDRRSAARMVIQGAILFLIVLGAFVSIAILVDTLSWRG